MLQSFKKNIVRIAMFLSLLLIVSAPIAVFAVNTPPPNEAQTNNYGLDTAANNTGLIDKSQAPQVIVGQVVGVILSFVGVIFLLLTIYAGLRWMLAQGNEAEIEKAKGTLISSVIGLIIVLAAYALTAFIGTQLAK